MAPVIIEWTKGRDRKWTEPPTCVIPCVNELPERESVHHDIVAQEPVVVLLPEEPLDPLLDRLWVLAAWRRDLPVASS